jgi:hypothetical protein
MYAGMSSNMTWKTDGKRRVACRLDAFHRDVAKNAIFSAGVPQISLDMTLENRRHRRDVTKRLHIYHR